MQLISFFIMFGFDMTYFVGREREREMLYIYCLSSVLG